MPLYLLLFLLFNVNTYHNVDLRPIFNIMAQARSSLRTLKHKEKKCKVRGTDIIQYIESLKIVPCVDVAVFKNKNNKDYLLNNILTLSY